MYSSEKTSGPGDRSLGPSPAHLYHGECGPCLVSVARDDEFRNVPSYEVLHVRVVGKTTSQNRAKVYTRLDGWF